MRAAWAILGLVATALALATATFSLTVIAFFGRTLGALVSTRPFDPAPLIDSWALIAAICAALIALFLRCLLANPALHRIESAAYMLIALIGLIPGLALIWHAPGFLITATVLPFACLMAAAWTARP